MAGKYQKQWVGVFGDPVDDNPTVVMGQASFDAEGIPMEYLTIQVRSGELEAVMNGLRAMNFTGINITMPHKGEVLKYLDEVSESVEIMGAVNTIYWKDNKLTGENTDGKGFIKSLRDGEIPLNGRNAVILGAGGAARAIAVELAGAGIRKITIINRSQKSGQALTDIVNEKTRADGTFLQWNGCIVIPTDTDILVNATPIGFTDDEKPNIDYDRLPEDVIVCDVIPNKLKTSFLKEAEERKLKTFNGLEMLVNQGALAYELWTGKKAPVEVMKQAMKKEYGE